MVFKDFELLFDEEERCLKIIIEKLQEKDNQHYDFMEKDLNSIGLQLETLHSLYNKNYIQGSFFDNNTRGIVCLTHKGKYYFEHKEQYIAFNKNNNYEQNLKYWIPIVLLNVMSTLSLIVSIFK